MRVEIKLKFLILFYFIPNYLIAKNYTANINLMAGLFGVYYREELPPPTDTETGALGALRTDLSFLINKRWWIRGGFEIDFGKTKYDGALQDGTPVVSQTNDFIFDAETVFGYRFYLSRFRIIPFLGFGLHYWNRGLTGIGAYTEKYTFYYLPIGTRLEGEFNSDFKWAFEISLLWNLGGSIQVYLSELSPPQQDATGTLGSALGVKICIPLRYQWNPSFQIVVSPFFEHFKIGEGDVFPTFDSSGQPLGGAQEPASATYFYGVHFGVGYSF